MAMAAVGRKVTMAAVAASKKCSSSATSTVGSLAVAKRLGDKGLSAQHGEAINEAMTNCLKSRVSKVEMQRELNFEKLSHKIDKMGMEIDKMCMKIEKMGKDIEKLSITSKAFNEKMNLTLKAEMQAGKYELVKNFIGAQVCVFAVGIAALSDMK